MVSTALAQNLPVSTVSAGDPVAATDINDIVAAVNQGGWDSSNGGMVVFQTAAVGVGIGTTSPGARLDVNGDLLISSGGNGAEHGLLFPDGTKQTTAVRTAVNNNVAVGQNALEGLTSGLSNTGVGNGALLSITFGQANVAVGHLALDSMSSGSFNVAVGTDALAVNQTGSDNVAIGRFALGGNNNGNNNIAIGTEAGFSSQGNNNIFIGSDGAAFDSNRINIGTNSFHTRTFIAGINGVTTGAPAIDVVIDANGQLGTVSSSRRYKEDIRDMRDASKGLVNLRPVTFRYKQAYADGAKPIQYGLIAEEVAEVYPDLVVYDDDGQADTVQYRKVNAMLLNEVQRQHRELREQQRQVEDLLARVAHLERRLTN